MLGNLAAVYNPGHVRGVSSLEIEVVAYEVIGVLVVLIVFVRLVGVIVVDVLWEG